MKTAYIYDSFGELYLWDSKGRILAEGTVMEGDNPKKVFKELKAIGEQIGYKVKTKLKNVV